MAEHMDAEAARAKVHEALSVLTVSQREVISLMYFGGHSQDEVAPVARPANRHREVSRAARHDQKWERDWIHHDLSQLDHVPDWGRRQAWRKQLSQVS